MVLDKGGGVELCVNKPSDELKEMGWIFIAPHGNDVCSMQGVSTVDTMGAIWGSTAMLHVLL